MMTCRDVATAVAAGSVRRHPVAMRMQIWMHLALCVPCRRFSRQLRAIDRGVSAWLQTLESEVPPDLEQRVANRLVDTLGGRGA